MCAKIAIITVFIAIALFQIAGIGFDYWFNYYEETGAVIPGKIVNVDRIITGEGSGYIELKIISETGEELIFKQAYNAHYEPGTEVKLHQYRKKITGGTRLVYHDSGA